MNNRHLVITPLLVFALQSGCGWTAGANSDPGSPKPGHHLYRLFIAARV